MRKVISSLFKLLVTMSAICIFLIISSDGANGSPQIDFVGNIYCNDGVGELPLKDITIELDHIASEKAISSQGSGYYRKRAPFGLVYDHNVTLLYKIGDRIVDQQSVFVSKGNRLRKRNNSLIYKMDKMVFYGTCDQLKLEIKESITNGQSKDPKKKNANGVEAATPLMEVTRYLLMLSSSSFGVPHGAPLGSTVTKVKHRVIPLSVMTSFEEGPGNLLAYSRNTLFPAFGFRYAPGRERAPSILTNSASSALGYSGQISSNFKLNSRKHLTGNINAVSPLFKRFILGVGGYLNNNEEELTVEYYKDNKLTSDFKFREYALLLSIAYRVSENIAIGVTHKYQHQKIDKAYVKRIDEYGYSADNPLEEKLISQVDTLVKETDTHSSYDCDVSFAVDVFSKYRIGATLLNALGSELLVDGEVESNQGYGFGITAFLERLNLGIDMENTERFGINGSMGINYIPANNWELGAGYLTHEQTMKISARYRSLSFSVSHGDNDWTYSIGSRFNF